MKLGFLGPKGTFSYEVAKSYGSKSQLIEYGTITEAVKGLKNNEIAEAIVRIENSIQGGVTETIKETKIESRPAKTELGEYIF